MGRSSIIRGGMPLRAADNTASSTRRSPLLLAPTPLIGREREVAAIRRQLVDPATRLLTLTGPGGVGKTRLALAGASALGGAFPDGVSFIDLSPLRAPALVLATIALTLGIRDEADQPPLERLQHALRASVALLVLDNFEQVLPAATDLVGLLAACAALTLLVTSRAPLRLRWERRYPVAPLALPAADAARDPEALATVPAVALFLDRARAVRPDFALSAANAGPVADLCRRLDGLPLALELAAARLDLVGPRDLVARLARHSGLPAVGMRDLPARHETLRAMLDSSHELLPLGARALLRRLTVCAGGCTAAAAAAIGADNAASPLPGAAGVDDALATLVDHSLLRVDDATDAGPRFAMLETIRDYAAEHLAASGEEAACRRRHAAYYLDLAERAAAELSGPQQLRWLTRLDRERDNYRAALTWALAEGDAAVGLSLGAALWWFWYLRGDVNEGGQWLAQLLDLPAAGPSVARAQVLLGAGTLAFQRDDLAMARTFGEAGLAQARAVGDAYALGIGLNLLGNVAQWSRSYAAARDCYAEAIAHFRRSPAPTPREQFGVSLSLTNLGVVAANVGDDRRAADLQEESLALTRALGNRQGTAHALLRLSAAVWRLADREGAKRLAGEALELFGDIGSPWGTASAQLLLARFAVQEGALPQAMALLADSLAFFRSADMKIEITRCFAVIAEIALRRGRAARAGHLLGAAQVLREALGAAPPQAERDDQDRLRAMGTAALGAAFAVAEGRGRAGGLALGTAEALAELAPAPAPPRTGDSGATLTAREREVAALVARGLTNRQIAELLSIAERTADNHVAHILDKLGFTSRAQVAAWAVREGLLAAPPSQN